MKLELPVDLKRKKSNALVIHCSDPRFQVAYRKIVDDTGLYYDLLVVPGASKAVVDNQSIMDYIKLLHELHHFEQVLILDHTLCAAFGQVDNEHKAHAEAFQQAKELIGRELPELKVSGQLVEQQDSSAL